MSGPGRDRDSRGRPRNARPRDRLGRPLPYGSEGVAVDLELIGLEGAEPAMLLAGAQRLLDEGRPFEAHELLEVAWKRAPDGERPMWRGLAQLAVGLTHRSRGNPRGATALFIRGAQLLEGVGDKAPYGIDACGLTTAGRRLAAGEPQDRLRLTR